MTAREILRELDQRGVMLEVQNGKLRFTPKDAVTPTLMAVMKEKKADIIATLSIPRLPWQLERLVSAATNDQLPKETVKLEAGLVKDLNTYVLGWAASYLLGGSHEALTRLWQARKAWQGTVAA
jgi:hypothetical protein